MNLGDILGRINVRDHVYIPPYIYVDNNPIIKTEPTGMLLATVDYEGSISVKYR